MNLLLLCTVLCVGCLQSDSTSTPDVPTLQDVLKENQTLKDQLAAAQLRIQQLENAQGTTPTGLTPKGAVPISKADAKAELLGNPIAVLDFFQKKFSEDMAKKHIALPQEKDSKATRAQYLAEVKKWIDMMSRTSYPIDWRGRIVDLVVESDTTQTLEFQCVSPDNKNNFGRVEKVTISKSIAPLLGKSIPDREMIWRMPATLTPAFFCEPEMIEANTFDNPPLIGPCVAFKYQVKVQRIYPEKSSAVTPAK